MRGLPARDLPAKGRPQRRQRRRGGDVILQADHDLNNLVAQFYNSRLLAPDGLPGLGKGMDGAAGKDLTVRVPCGTLVWSVEAAEAPPAEEGAESGTLLTATAGRRSSAAPATERAQEMDLEEQTPERHSPRKGELIADLTRDGQQFVLCKGGRGGLGNRNFATSRRQTPRFAQPGEAAARANFCWRLRTIADVGLVGCPNAGKSTLLGAISQAHPKVAPYPFTTLHPQIGIVEYPDFFRLTVCDVPGLMRWRNARLGHESRRHVKRCRLLGHFD